MGFSNDIILQQSQKNLDEQRQESTFSESQTQYIFTTLANALGKKEDKLQASFTVQDMYDLVMWEIQLQMMESDSKEIRLDYYHELLKQSSPVEVSTPQHAFIKFIHEVKEVLSFEQMKLAITLRESRLHNKQFGREGQPIDMFSIREGLAKHIITF